MNKDILLLGASGLIGGYLFEELSRERRVVGTYYKNKKQGLVHFDLLSSDIRSMPLENTGYCVMCSAMTKIDACAENSSVSHRINVDGVKRVIEKLSQRRIVPVFFSSASVFDGVKGGYKEEDIKNPTTLYGGQKADIEDFLVSEKIDSLIIRPGKVFGVKSGEGVLFTNWLEKYLRGEEIKCADDEQLSPTYVRDVARGTKELIDRDARGIYHLNFPEHMSRYQMAAFFFSYLKIKDARIKRCSIDEFHSIEKMPRNTFLDSTKFVGETGFEFTPLERCYDEIRRTFLYRS